MTQSLRNSLSWAQPGAGIPNPALRSLPLGPGRAARASSCVEQAVPCESRSVKGRGSPGSRDAAPPACPAAGATFPAQPPNAVAQPAQTLLLLPATNRAAVPARAALGQGGCVSPEGLAAGALAAPPRSMLMLLG